MFKKSAIIITIVFATFSRSYSMRTQPIITPQQLLENPLAVVQKSRQKLEKFITKYTPYLDDNNCNSTDFIKTITTLFASYGQKHPLFLIHECGSKGENECILSRSNNPYYRQAFENRVSSSLRGKINSFPGRAINYVSFGCGNAFPDLVITTQVLMKKPTAHINLHMIDISYAPLVALQQDCQVTQAITKIFLPFYGYNKIKKLANQAQAPLKIVKTRITQTLYPIMLYRQFLVWLKHYFPQATLSVYVYDSVENYFNYQKNYDLFPADVISAADIRDGMSSIKSSIYHNHLLCLKTLRENRHATAIHLDFLETGEVALFNFGLEKKNDTQETITFDNNLPNLYRSMEKL